MKKFLCVSVAITLLFSTLEAQHTQFGVKAGANFSKMSVDPGTNLDTKSGLHIGGLAHIHLSSQFAIQPELVFSMQGGEYEEGAQDYKLKLNYVNVPVLAQYMFGDGFRVQTGPQVGFRTSAEVKYGDTEVDLDDDYKSIDFSWAFGGGYLFKNGLGIDARYNLGLSNIREDDAYEAKNQVIQVGLFYQFGK